MTDSETYLATAQRCGRDTLSGFASYVSPWWEAAHHHWLICHELERVERGEIRRLLIQVPPRHGKALALDTPIATPVGWSSMGDLRPGDVVFGSDGVPCNVVAVSPVWRDRPVYNVTTDDGDVIVADEEHEWRARLCGKRPTFKDHTTKVLARKRCKRAMIERALPLSMPRVSLPSDPYTLGVWLGDGCSNHATITQGDVDMEFVRSEVEKSYRTSDRGTRGTFGVLGLQKQLRKLGLLGNKHIPMRYLRASEGQRLALLQGLIDTDGHVNQDGQVEFTTVNKRLAEEVRELVYTLGRKASLCEGRATLNGKDCGAKYRVMFYHAMAARLPRKRALCRDVQKTPHRYVSAKACGVADTVCIQVDSPDHMFLAGRSMLPTHNSELFSVHFPAWYLGRNPDRRVIHAAYGSDLSNLFSRRVRNLLRDSEYYHTLFPGVKLSGDAGSVTQWELDGHRGGFRSVGIGGGVTGHGADLALIDDPVKSAESAESAVQRDAVWAWYTSELVTRLHPNAAIVLGLTRWHEDDLAGRILANDGDRWTVLSLPAIDEQGQALWPERYDVDALHEIERSVGSRVWAALYQQQPTGASGNEFKREWFADTYTTLPPIDEAWTRWDTALKDSEKNDRTAFITVAHGRDGQLYGVNGGAGHWSGDEIRAALESNYADCTRRFGPAYRGEYIEDAAAGALMLQAGRSSVMPTTARLLPVKVPNVGKIVRARGVAPFVESRRFRAPSIGVWWHEVFLPEICAFPFGAHDDCTDVFIGALEREMGLREDRHRELDAPRCAWAKDVGDSPRDRLRRAVRGAL